MKQAGAKTFRALQGNDNTQYFLLPCFIHENKSTFTNQGTAPVGPMHQQQRELCQPSEPWFHGHCGDGSTVGLHDLSGPLQL